MYGENIGLTDKLVNVFNRLDTVHEWMWQTAGQTDWQTELAKFVGNDYKRFLPVRTPFVLESVWGTSSRSGISTATKARGDNADDGRLTSTSGDVTGPPYNFRSAAVRTLISDWNCRDVARVRLGGAWWTCPGFEALADALNRDRRLGQRDCFEPPPRTAGEDVTSSRNTFFSRSNRLWSHYHIS